MSMMVSFCAALFPTTPGVLDKILNLIESVSENFPSYSYNKNSAECYVAPAFYLHLKDSINASVWYTFGQNPFGRS